MKQEYTKQELADIREKEHDQWFDKKFDEILLEDHSEITATEKYDLTIKDMTSWTLHKDKIEVKNSKGITSFMYLSNPDNSFIAQMIVNLHKDKELKC